MVCGGKKGALFKREQGPPTTAMLRNRRLQPLIQDAAVKDYSVVFGVGSVLVVGDARESPMTPGGLSGGPWPGLRRRLRAVAVSLEAL